MLLRDVDLAAVAARSRFARDASPGTRRCTPVAGHREMHDKSDASTMSRRGDGDGGGGGCPLVSRRASDGVREEETLPAA